jgi:hypothetical protein
MEWNRVHYLVPSDNLILLCAMFRTLYCTFSFLRRDDPDNLIRWRYVGHESYYRQAKTLRRARSGGGTPGSATWACPTAVRVLCCTSAAQINCYIIVTAGEVRLSPFHLAIDLPNLGQNGDPRKWHTSLLTFSRGLASWVGPPRPATVLAAKWKGENFLHLVGFKRL